MRLRVQFAEIVHNEQYKDKRGEKHRRSRRFYPDQTVLIYDWQLKKDKLTDDESRVYAEYRKATNKTKITEKDKKGKTKKVTTKSGFVSVTVSTNNKNIIWEY